MVSFRPLLKARRHPRAACAPRAKLQAPGTLKRSAMVTREVCDASGGAQMSPALDVLYRPKCSGFLGSSSASRPARVSDPWAFRYPLVPQERQACPRKHLKPTPCSAWRLPSQCWSEREGLGAQGFLLSSGVFNGGRDRSIPAFGRCERVEGSGLLVHAQTFAICEHWTRLRSLEFPLVWTT